MKNSPYGTSPDKTAEVWTTRTSGRPSRAACPKMAPLTNATVKMTARTTRSICRCSGVRVVVHC